MVGRPEDRGLLCGIAGELLDQAGPARVNLLDFFARIRERAEVEEQRPRLERLLAQASLDQLDGFFRRVRERRAQLAAPPTGA